MSIIDKFFRREKSKIPYRGYFPTGGLIPPDLTRHDYLNLYTNGGWWHAVVFRIALGLSEVKWTLWNVATRDKPKQIYDHPILNFLHLVNPFQTSEEFIALDTIYMECLGESFWALNFNQNGEPAEAVLPYPDKMSVIPDKQFPFVKGYVYGSGTDAIPFDVGEIIHFKYPNPLNQYRGLGQAQAIGVNLDAERNADKWVNQFFYNSARPDGVIQFDYNLSDEQYEKLKKQWAERHQGTSKAHKIALLEGGGKYVQIQNTVKDMDFANLKLKNRDIILGVEGMPLSVMGISENVNKANAEAGDYTFARWIVKPRLDWKKAKLQEQLMSKFKNSKKLQLGFEEIVPETTEQKRDLAESGMRAGYLTINEARKLQALDPLPNGDVLLVPLNLVPTPISGEPMESPEEPEEPRRIAPKTSPPDYNRTHWEAFAKKAERQEEMFKRVFEAIFDEQKKQVVGEYEKRGRLPPDLDDEGTAKHFEPAIELIYQSAFDEAIPQKGVKQLDEFARGWIATRSFTLAKSINMTTLEALRHELSLGFEAGESIQQLTKRLGGYFTENAKHRAEMISRTEVIAASNEGALHRYEEEGIEKSEFYPSPDACPECEVLAGEYPTRQVHGMIPVHPNCRCVFLPIV